MDGGPAQRDISCSFVVRFHARQSDKHRREHCEDVGLDEGYQQFEQVHENAEDHRHHGHRTVHHRAHAHCHEHEAGEAEDHRVSRHHMLANRRIIMRKYWPIPDELDGRRIIGTPGHLSQVALLGQKISCIRVRVLNTLVAMNVAMANSRVIEHAGDCPCPAGKMIETNPH